MECAAYRRAREEFFARHEGRWPATISEPYDILAPYPLARGELEQIHAATSALSLVYEHAASWLRALPDEALVGLGLARRLLPVVKTWMPQLEAFAWGRFDFARTADGYRMLEFNVDVPGLVVEAFSVNAAASAECGRRDVNEGDEERLRATLASAVSASAGWLDAGGDVAVAVTASAASPKDRAIAEYLSALLETIDARYVPFESLAEGPRGLQSSDGRAIDVLVRILSLDRLAGADVSSSLTTAATVDRLIADRRLALINPPVSQLLESKALQAVLWAVAAAGDVLDAEDRDAVHRYMLPTFFEPPGGETTWVAKPHYGLEGDSIRIDGGGLAIVSRGSTFSDGPFVYQQYVALPQEELPTEYGPRRLHLLTSCFSLGGVPAGVCMRAGGPITDADAWVVPLYLADA